MRSCINRALFFSLVFAAASLPLPGAPSAVPPSRAKKPPMAIGPVWHGNLNEAQVRAGQENKPILIYFSSPESIWCTAFKMEVLRAPALQPVLERFVLVEMDPVVAPAAAGRFKVLGTPAVRILDAQANVLASFDGAQAADEFAAALQAALDPNALPKGQDLEALFAQLKEAKSGASVWPALMAAMGAEKSRKVIHDRIFAMQPFPRQELVALLDDPRIVVRLGAMELLEEAAGDSFRFNPWRDDSSALSTEGIALWKAWAAGSGPLLPPDKSRPLSREELTAAVKDLISDNPERSERALRNLVRGGTDAASFLSEFLGTNKDIPEGSRLKVKEALYVLQLQGKRDVDAVRIAHQLLFGNLDNRLGAITDLAKARSAALPILAELMASREPIVRETAIDAAFAADRMAALPLIAKALANEKDVNVLLCSSRGLAMVTSPQSVALLRAQLSDDREEVISAALHSLGQLKATDAEPDLRRLLNDSRWRVRVSALETAAAIPLPLLADVVATKVSDPDEFVRISAVTALGKLNGKNYIAVLEKVFADEDALKPAIINTYEAFDTPLPPSFLRALEKKPASVTLPVLSAMSSTKGASALIPIYFARQKDLDVACAAIRVLARNPNTDASIEALTRVLRDGPDEKRRAVFDDLSMYAVRENLQRIRPGATANKGKDGFATAVLHCAQSSQSLDLSRQAGLCLVKSGNSAGLKYLGDISTLTTEHRSDLAEAADAFDATLSAALLPKLLRDSSTEIRVDALGNYTSNSGVSFKIVSEALADGESIPFNSRILNYVASAMQNRDEFRREAVAALKTLANTKLQTAILCGMTRSGDERAAAVALEFTQSKDPFQRRAAWYAFGRTNLAKLPAHAKEITSDSSSYVREVFPALYTPNMTRWLRYADKDTTDMGYEYYHHEIKLSADVEQSIRALLNDADSRVRLMAYFALYTNNRAVDKEKMIEAVQSEPDQKWIGEVLGAYFDRVGTTLTAEQAFLLPYGKEESYYNNYREAKARLLGATKPAASVTTSAAVIPAASPLAVTPNPKEHAVFTEPSAAGPPIKLIFFESPGCPDCAKIKKMIAQMQETVPSLNVETRNIRTTESLRLNEALSQKFGVPQNLRLVAPAIFAGGGFLVKSDITSEQLGRLIAASANVPLQNWYTLEAPALAQAEQSITSRYQTLNAGIILLAGLLDGVNPCAFATIIFFLSYLQVARRSPAQILQVGAAFVGAVFLTYFVLGLGLVEIIGQLLVFKWLSTLLNVVLALMALVIAGLSFRDGMLSLRGKMTDMTLQLPEFLKARIHAVVRTNVRHSRFVLAAFGSGVVISLLELACTGQVYAPTILFMLKTGQGRSDAIGYLLVYNLAFILPLTVVFLLAYFGLRSQTLAKTLQQHTTIVKFATAALFFGLFALILFSGRLT